MTMESLAQTLLFKPSNTVILLRNLIVIFICVFFLSNGLNSWFQYQLEPDYSGRVNRQDPGRTADNSHALEQTAVDTGIIIERNVFGGSPYEPSEEEKKQMALEQIPLAENLKHFLLIGTIIKSDAENIAIIEDKKKRQQQMYVRGDQLEGATIKQILRNNVVVNDGNEDKMLSIDYQLRQRMQKATATVEDEVASDWPQQTFSLDKQYVQTAMSDMNALLQSARIRPFIRNGKPQGFELSRIRKDSLFDRLHLHDGDILLGTEGMDITNPQQILNLSKELKNKDAVKLRLNRKGRDMLFEYNLQ